MHGKMLLLGLALIVLLGTLTGNAEENNRTGAFDLDHGTVLLNSGYTMPVIGLGTWTLSDDQADRSTESL